MKKKMCKSERKLANNKNHIRQLKKNKQEAVKRRNRIQAMEAAKREARANV